MPYPRGAGYSQNRLADGGVAYQAPRVIQSTAFAKPAATPVAPPPRTPPIRMAPGVPKMLPASPKPVSVSPPIRVPGGTGPILTGPIFGPGLNTAGPGSTAPDGGGNFNAPPPGVSMSPAGGGPGQSVSVFASLPLWAWVLLALAAYYALSHRS